MKEEIGRTKLYNSVDSDCTGRGGAGQVESSLVELGWVGGRVKLNRNRNRNQNRNRNRNRISRVGSAISTESVTFLHVHTMPCHIRGSSFHSTPACLCHIRGSSFHSTPACLCHIRGSSFHSTLLFHPISISTSPPIQPNNARRGQPVEQSSACQQFSPPHHTTPHHIPLYSPPTPHHTPTTSFASAFLHSHPPTLPFLLSFSLPPPGTDGTERNGTERDGLATLIF